ncbi:MAG: TrpB-like pyridoxal phosphate-dependent enzyme [Candidatus Marinimicrobia bacterium]|jgi:tryptophan synthase beta chain|nr:TrpB-like pyridoxal phosphate-dependent enzyme [Candidatus Neomarinimicrobiota bacterium]MDP6456887.1 TrpB-like pyridoxal phosphate-dependent enzyme [Candidatus Neomarinimicrobiota bacterium]MDP6592764.1 TrpB-like pyridoxal phosphate-dependent enzyme [Candidatus Neomarinimicrobiota bacterium]MDP6836285.1 TrpB-like pyridoxal phosphate-dependent enzyme [Candidatus Neomarinimicrobiota bacterium]|tara:strand:- start:6501 stop:7859 length:1359 start_codon:yes stop_codon:yes gene_type:complete
MNQTKIQLDEKDIPRQWYNVAADMETPPPPPINPGTGEPIGPDDLAPLFPMGLILQEVSQERYIDIPEPVLEALSLYRPSPLYRAHRLEKVLGTPAKIYYKYEGVSPPGSHKPNTAIAQAFYNKEEGVKRLSTETGAGQWGSALSYAAQMFGLECKVYMVRISFDQKPYRKAFMQTFGAEIVASPSPDTEAGRKILEQTPDTPGSLGIAISEAVEDAATREDTKYSLGSVLNHVLTHQTIIGQEAMKQMEIAGDSPDVVIGCVGGGSNFAGLAFPFVRDKINGKDIDFVAAEPTACPTLTKGEWRYDFGDTIGMTPLVPMYTLGHTFTPEPIHAGGLRYHGDAPMLCQLVKDGIIRAEAHEQNDVFAAAVQFARAEGIVPAPESSHAIKSAIDAAVQAKEAGEEKTILFGLSGHGHFDMLAYDNYFAGNLEDKPFSDEDLKESLAALEGLPV